MGRPPASALEEIYFACGKCQTMVNKMCAVNIPLLSSFSAPLVACRALKPFLFCLVVLRWWCDCTAMGAMLPLPPALNLKGIDATLTADCANARVSLVCACKCGTVEIILVGLSITVT
mgnify:CR=1 FL=1